MVSELTRPSPMPIMGEVTPAPPVTTEAAVYGGPQHHAETQTHRQTKEASAQRRIKKLETRLQRLRQRSAVDAPATAAHPEDSDDHTSSSSSSEESSSDDEPMHRHRSPVAPQQPANMHHASAKEPHCADPPSFDMKRGKDFRPYVEGCELYMELRPNQFPSARIKILWAMGFLEGERAQNWARNYRSKMGSSQHGKYISWKFFKSKLQKACDVAEGDTDALRKMQNAKYKGDIEAYVDKVKFLNERAGVTKAALRDIIRKALPEAVVRMLPMCGGMDTDKQI